jgi:glyoxylase-like metal-dependent hydrolase (beta-lactamase superfamily II)
VSARIEPIDVHHLDRDRVICCWRVGDSLVDPGPESTLPTLLAALGADRPQRILLTHIHLDHAGATGALVRRWPDLEVCVHERGAPHVIDPAKLLASASRLYGEENMERLWGETVPVPEANVRVLAGGERLDGGIEVAYSPGHASHHVTYLHADTRTAFTGDVAGVRIPPAHFALAPTPPPDIDVERWHESLDALAAWAPRRMCLTHFGAVEDDVPGHLAEVGRRLDAWSVLARDNDEASFIARVENEIERAADLDTAAAFAQAAPPEQLHAGLARYWRKRAEAAA